MSGNHRIAVTADVMITLAASERSSVARRIVQSANAIDGTSARYAPPGSSADNATLIAIQQRAWPMNRPSKPAGLRNAAAQMIAVAAPMSHIAVRIGPGCASQFAPGVR